MNECSANKFFYIQTNKIMKKSETYRCFRVFKPTVVKGSLVMKDVTKQIAIESKVSYQPHYGLKLAGSGWSFDDWLRDHFNGGVDSQQLFISREVNNG